MSNGNKQVGMLVVKEGKVLGLELFDNPKSFEAYKDALFQRYALDIATKGEKTVVDIPALMESLFAELEACQAIAGDQSQNVGGENIFLQSKDIAATFFQRGRFPIYISVTRK